MEELLSKIRACNLCNDLLPLGPRPIVVTSPKSRIAIIGQAPGSVVHESGVPWDDKSGENLRAWMQISSEDFYNPDKLALIPMGFCYPGRGKSGDNPPTGICAPTWHDQLLNELQELRLVFLVGKYAQDYYLGDTAQKTLTQTVQQFEDYLPKYFALPHPSPRNNIWQAKNPWFKASVLPRLRQEVASALR